MKNKKIKIALISTGAGLFFLSSQSNVNAQDVNPESDAVEDTLSQDLIDQTSVDFSEEVKILSDSKEAAQILSVTNQVETDVKDTNIQVNLIPNGDFSELEECDNPWSGTKPKGFSTWYPVGEDETPLDIIDNEILVVEAEESVRISIETESIEVSADKTYSLSVDIKTEDVTGASRVRIRELNEINEQIKLFYTQDVRGTTDWQTYTLDYIPSENTQRVLIQMFHGDNSGGTGTTSFKNLRFSEATVRATEPLALEDEVVMDIDQKYLPNLSEYSYFIHDEKVASLNENGFIIPKSLGVTEIDAIDQNDRVIKKIHLEVVSSDVDFKNALDEWNRIIAGNEFYDPDNPVMRENHLKLEKQVQEIISLYQPNLDNQQIFTDIDEYQTSANITTTYRRLETLAKQFTNSHSKYFEAQEILRIIKESFDFMYKEVYNEESYIIGNWWDYEIGVPRAINNTLSLLQNYFLQDQITRYTAPIQHFVPESTHFRQTLEPFEALGGNLVDMGRVKFIYGLLNRDEQVMSETVDAMGKLFNIVSEGEGFYEDGSYIDHTNVAYTGAYGSVLMDGLSQLLPLIQSSTTPFSQEQLDIVEHWITQSFMPILFKGELMDMTRGRSISRSNLESHAAAVEVLRSFARLSEVSEIKKREEIQLFVKAQILSDTYYDIFDNLTAYKDIQLIQSILNNDKIIEMDIESYIHTFNNMDKFVMYNKDLDVAFALSFFSDKTQNYEYMNKENIQGWFTGDGMVYLYNDDLSHYSDNYWPTVDPYHLPGVTNTTEPMEEGYGENTLNSDKVGQISSDNHNAVIGMDFNNWNNSLRTKKSWFVFNDKIVFLGSPVENTSDYSAHTTIENRKIHDDHYSIYINGELNELVKTTTDNFEEINSIFLKSNNVKNNIGYYFLNPSDVVVGTTEEIGSWKDINDGQSPEELSNEFIQIYQPHDDNNVGYAYVMMPAVNESEFNSIVDSNTIHVLHNDDSAQVVYDSETKTLGVVKFDNTTLELEDVHIKLDQPGVYLFETVDNGFAIKGSLFNETALESALQLLDEDDKLQVIDIDEVLILFGDRSSDAEDSTNAPTEHEENDSEDLSDGETGFGDLEDDGDERSEDSDDKPADDAVLPHAQDKDFDFSIESDDPEQEESTQPSDKPVSESAKMLPSTGEKRNNPLFVLLFSLMGAVALFRNSWKS